MATKETAELKNHIAEMPRNAANQAATGQGRRQVNDESLKSPRSTVESIVAALEEDIVLGKLHPRERLIEEDLCTRFGITRHVLRQSLVELERMGLIERIPNRGAQVRAMSSDDVNELYALRDVLEKTAAEQIVLPAGDSDLAELRDIQARHDQAMEDIDLVAVFRSNHQFHRKLFSLCKNRFLAEAIDLFAQRAHGVRFLAMADPNEREKAQIEHHKIIAAIEDCDREALVALCHAHLLPSRTAYLTAFGKLLS